MAGSHSVLVRWDRGQTCLVLAHRGDVAGRVTATVAAGTALGRAVLGAPRQQLPALLHLTDVAPLPVRRRVRSRVVLAGWLSPSQRTADDPVSESTLCLHMDLAGVTISKDGGPVAVPLDEYASARPDHLVHHEATLLQRLVTDGAALAALARLVEPAVIQHCVAVMPLALDRYGLELRVEHRRRHADVRLAFPIDVDDTASASRAVDLLIRQGQLTRCGRVRQAVR